MNSIIADSIDTLISVSLSTSRNIGISFNISALSEN